MGCTIYHNSFSTKHLPLLLLARELALFRTAGPRTPARLSQIGFVLHIRPRSRGPVPPGPAGNWLCFAQRAPGHQPGLPRIGFVLHIRPSSQCPVPAGPAGRIGFVLCIFRSPGTCPVCESGRIGFVLHSSPSADPAFREGGAKLALFVQPALEGPEATGARAAGGPHGRGAAGGKLALFGATAPTPRVHQAPPGIGFVSHNRPFVPRPWGLVPAGVAGNWVRFPRLPLVPQAPSPPAPPGHLPRATGDYRCRLDVSVMRTFHHIKTFLDAHLLTQKPKVPQKFSRQAAVGRERQSPDWPLKELGTGNRQRGTALSTTEHGGHGDGRRRTAGEALRLKSGVGTRGSPEGGRS